LIASKAQDALEWEFNPADLEDARERVAGEISKRRGQPAFRRKLLKIYGNRCAITGCNAVEVLEACHIVPYLGPKTNHPSNGLVLRADLHTLFDLGLVTIDPQNMSVRVVLRPSRPPPH
jgi:predicted restriction endonuclease